MHKCVVKYGNMIGKNSNLLQGGCDYPGGVWVVLGGVLLYLYCFMYLKKSEA